MITQVVLEFVDLFVFIFNILILARVIASYVAKPGGQLQERLIALTEPLLAPVRRLLPQSPGLDLAPLAAFFGLQGIQLLFKIVLGA